MVLIEFLLRSWRRSRNCCVLVIRKKHPRIISIAETNVAGEVGMLKNAGYDQVIYQDGSEWEILKKYLNSDAVKRRVNRKSKRVK